MSPAEGGTVTLSTPSQVVGEEVTFNLEIGSNYCGFGLSCADGSSEPVTIIPQNLIVDEWKFTMPNSDVTISVTLTAHEWEEDFTVDKEPTCTGKGSKSIHCRHCDAVKDSTETEALGHAFGEWTVTKQATADEEGEETRTCSRCGKKETRHIEKLTPQEGSYYNAAGDGGTWTKGSNDTLDFIFKRSEDDEAAFGHFTGIKVDGKAVPEKDASGKANYTAGSGSVVIGLQPLFLETLSAGKHTLTVGFDDGSASAEFTVREKKQDIPDDSSKKEKNDADGSSSKRSGRTGGSTKTAVSVNKAAAPKTGDESGVLLWIWLTAVSLGALLFAGHRRGYLK